VFLLFFYTAETPVFQEERNRPTYVVLFFFEELGLIQPCMSRELLLGRELSRPPDRYQAMKSTL